MAIKESIKVLEEFNLWRRGKGAYEWSEDPSKNVEFPYSPKALGDAIDHAVSALKALDGNTCECKTCAFKGMELCEHRKYLDWVSRLRIALAVNNNLLGDIAGPLYDHDLHAEEDEVLAMIMDNLKVLEATKPDVVEK